MVSDMDTTECKIKAIVREEKWYVGLVIPWYVSFTIYMLVGIPVL